MGQVIRRIGLGRQRGRVLQCVAVWAACVLVTGTSRGQVTESADPATVEGGVAQESVDEASAEQAAELTQALVAEPVEEATEEATEDVADQSPASEQAALDSELASARRFEAELDALLLPNGRLDPSQDNAAAKLRSLATRCGILANSARIDAPRLLLLGYQARALSALASVDAADRDEALALIEQLTDTARQIAAIDLPAAASAAGYWELVGVMSRQARGSDRPTLRLARVEAALVAFIETHGQDAAAADYLLDARLSLAQLMDQRGAQRDAKPLLDQLADLPQDSPRFAELVRLRGSVERLATPVDFESVSTQLVRWRSADHLGKPVLIHVYAEGVASSVHMIDVINRSIVEGTIRDIAVVSLRIGEPSAAVAAPPWPTLPVQLKPGGILDTLGVAALPTLAWLDSDGKLVAIGSTAAVLDQLKTIAPDTNEANDDQPTSTPLVPGGDADSPQPDRAPPIAPLAPDPADPPRDENFPF